MTTRIGWILLLVLTADVCAAQSQMSATRPSGDVVIIAGRVLDPVTARYSESSAIIVRGTRIVDVIPQARFIRQAGDSVIDLSKLTVLPGLIDAHVHLAIGGTVANNAKADLDAGFTTVADLGSRTNRMLRLRDSINAGFIPGPRVLATGMWIGTKGGVCEFNGLGLDGGPDAFKQRVIENAGAGANLIKVCISGWPAESFAQPDKYEISDAALDAVVKESRARGKRVVAHDISAGGVRAALRFGVDGLAHTAFVDEALASDLAKKNVFMITTLASLTQGDTSAAARALVKSIGIAARAGVSLVVGTDGGVLPHGQNAQEFLALASAGVPAGDAIRAATVNAARALGIQDSVGLIKRGMSADLIAVEGDPLANLAAFGKVSWVMLQGKVRKP